MVSPAREGGAGGGEPTQPSLRRLREHDVRPRHDLGQNFLIDSNMLEVIGSLADVGPGDTVLEVGGGLGVLSEYLAPACGYLHVIEAFGPDRCMFESNFPVDRLSLSYRTFWNAAKKIAAPFSEDEKDAMFRGTAARVYSL